MLSGHLTVGEDGGGITWGVRRFVELDAVRDDDERGGGGAEGAEEEGARGVAVLRIFDREGGTLLEQASVVAGLRLYGGHFRAHPSDALLWRFDVRVFGRRRFFGARGGGGGTIRLGAQHEKTKAQMNRLEDIITYKNIADSAV